MSAISSIYGKGIIKKAAKRSRAEARKRKGGVSRRKSDAKSTRMMSGPVKVLVQDGELVDNEYGCVKDVVMECQRPVKKPFFTLAKPETSSALKIYLDVPYKHKEAAKIAGAKWDMGAKKWYVDDTESASRAIRWMKGKIKDSLTAPHGETAYERDRRLSMERSPNKKPKKQLPVHLQEMFGVKPVTREEEGLRVDNVTNAFAARINGIDKRERDGLLTPHKETRYEREQRLAGIGRELSKEELKKQLQEKNRSSRNRKTNTQVARI